MAPPPSSRSLLKAAEPPGPALPVLKPGNTDQAILDALARLGPGAGSARGLLEAPAAGPGVPARTPGEALGDPTATVSSDVVVTAVRRLPAAPAMYAPMPEALDRRLVSALATR